MDIEQVRAHCLAKAGSSEDLPFGPDTLVFRVHNKAFALLSLDALPARVNLKCDPERAIALRESYPAVTAGYHMNKRHWNTVILDGSVPRESIAEWIDHSYTLVVATLSRKDREALQA